jgi:hypothetical protein
MQQQDAEAAVAAGVLTTVELKKGPKQQHQQQALAHENERGNCSNAGGQKAT